MARTLVLAEKPSVARDIARVLGANQRGNGCLENGNYVVTWAVGHLVSLVEPDELDEKYKKWRSEDLPILPESIPTKVLPKTKEQYRIVESWMRSDQIDTIVCATDSGREGELIFRYIYEKAKCTKPVNRLWISSMTDAAIREGFAQIQPDSVYDPLYVSARSRSAADWLVGMNASRAFTLRYGALLSIGRVQTPTLKLIVERDIAISEFKPEEYYEIRADFGDYTGLWQHPKNGDSRCPDEATAKKIKAETQGKEGVITAVKREKKKQAPPQLYDLTSLQREANKALGLSAAKTLDIAQALYEKHKLITYPRTDSRYLTHDMVSKIEKTFTAMPEPYSTMKRDRLEKPVQFSRVFNDSKVSDHHAIVPTGQFSALPRLSPVEKSVFDMVARRLIAVYMPDYLYESAMVLTEVAGHTFKSSGTTPVSPGWKALYPGSRKEDGKEQEVAIPPVR
ncbi:MAG: DNA topoisomerase III, partial [Clostridia bacterium]|nr:DNA topoisomerase III [Clostridia bacterium]